MLARLLSGSKKKGDDRVSARKSKKGESPLGALDSVDSKQKKGILAEDIVLNNAERQIYQHKMPETQNDMGNMISEHDQVSVFPHVAILDEPPESLESRYRKLTQLQPRVEKRRLDVPDYINLKLTKPVEEFSFSSIVQISDRKRKGVTMDYVHIKRAAIILAPLSSFIDNHSDVIVSIVDTRKRANHTARSLRLQDNKRYKGEFILDYSFPKESSHKISLSFAQEVQTYDDGEQWGACQMFLEMEESDFPLSVAFQETIGQAAVTTSILQQYKFHPGHLDLAIRDSHIPNMRELYQEGMIVDETEPMHDRSKRASYAKSGGEALKDARYGKKSVAIGKDGAVDWSSVRNSSKALIPAHQKSTDPEEGSDVEETTQEKIARMNLIANQTVLTRDKEFGIIDSPKRMKSPPPRARFARSESSGETVPVGTIGRTINPEE